MGYDLSAGLLAQARARYPKLAFHSAALPALEGIADASFANVLCETVIMHLPRDDVAPAVRRLLAILAPGGVLYLSWRVTRGADLRDGHGRLYGAFDADLVRGALGSAEVLLDEEAVSESSGKMIHRLVVRKVVVRHFVVSAGELAILAPSHSGARACARTRNPDLRTEVATNLQEELDSGFRCAAPRNDGEMFVARWRVPA